MSIELTTFKQGLVLFWSVWITLVFVTNLFDALRVAGVLPEGWKFFSGNYKYINHATDRYAVPGWITGSLFVGVLIWEGLAVISYWVGFQSYTSGGAAALDRVTTALAVTIALWAAFMIADEIFRIYDQQTTHLLLFISQLGTLLALHLLPPF